MMYLVKYGEAAVLTGLKLITAGATDFQSSPTLAAGDVKLNKDGVVANLATLPTLLPAASTEVRVVLSSSETQCAMGTINFVDQTGPKEWDDNAYQFVTYGHPSAYFQFDFNSPTVALSAASLTQVENSVWEAQRDSHQVIGTMGEGVRLSETEHTALTNFILDLANTIETDVNLRGALRLILATTAGTSSGAESGTLTYKNPVAEDKNRVVMVTDSNNNRVAGTWDQTDS